MKHLFETMKNLKDNRNADVVTFDFDNTIVKSFMNQNIDGEEQYQFGGLNLEIIKRIKSFKAEGKTVLVVTSRNADLEAPESSVKNILRDLNIEVDGIFYTNGQPKAKKLYELGSTLHYDDSQRERDDIEAFKKMHKDFNITTKDPEELLKDIQEISKGIIVTSDNKFIIAERSDSFEWDAPGGHVEEGEEPPFAFWREVKEELGLEVQEVQYLETLETTWQGISKPSHYFLGRTKYSSDELEGVIDLQWEVSNYFCGSYDELIRKSKGNMTQNLENTLQLVGMQQEIIESYQPHSKNHSVKKRRIIGLGGAKSTGATGLKKVKDFSRSKSAPAGFGALEEEDKKKPMRKIKISILSDIEERKKRKKRKKKKKSSTSSKKMATYWPFWGFATDTDGDGDFGGDGGGE